MRGRFYWLAHGFILGFACLFIQDLHAQSQPRLVIGIVVDQMRWDYLHRYEHRWTEKGGFRRLLGKGFTFDNTYINYLPSFTASGHAAIYTGTVPAVHGITGNNWWDGKAQSFVYCTSDANVKTVGSNSDAGEMSPVNLLSTTICDQLRLSTNFRGKTIGIALKDRGGILAAGHTANAAYWYDVDEAAWVSSTYYMAETPDWVKQFKTRSRVDSFYSLGWNLLFPQETYTQSVGERKTYEVRTFGTSQRQLPYDLSRFEGVNYGILVGTPYGNTLTTDFAKAAIAGEGLGADTIPDFLALSYSSPDYIGHAFGPNSVEMEDTYIRFDRELGQFFDFLDTKVGAGKYLVFLTADHGAAHVPGFMKENKLKGGFIDDKNLVNQLNEELKNQFGVESLCKTIVNFQVVFNRDVLSQNKKLNEAEIISRTIKWLEGQPGISRAFRLDEINRIPIEQTLKTGVLNGYYPLRSGQIQIVYEPGFIEGFMRGGTTHGAGYSYDTHIPLIWYGAGVPAGGKSVRKVNMTDIAPTLAALLDIQEPDGSIGNILYELFEQAKSSAK